MFPDNSKQKFGSQTLFIFYKLGTWSSQPTFPHPEFVVLFSTTPCGEHFVNLDHQKCFHIDFVVSGTVSLSVDTKLVFVIPT